MSTQKAKFELFSRLQELGFTYEESVALRRIEMTLRRWAEQECGDGNDYVSWAIERDETTNRPYKVIYPHDGKSRRYPVADREAGALKRLKAIVEARNQRAGKPSTFAQDMGLSRDVLFYHQTDPRGCALYMIRANDVPHGAKLDSCYMKGIAVCA